MIHEPRVLFTIGYGNQMPASFIERLKENKVNMVFDVRRAGSRSWLRDYYQGYFHGIELNIHKLFIGAQISYWPLPMLSNDCDSLDEYRYWIHHNEQAACTLDNIAPFIDGNPIIACILCAEKDFRRCHRATVACELASRLNVLVEQECERIANAAGTNAVSEWPCGWTIQHI